MGTLTLFEAVAKLNDTMVEYFLKNDKEMANKKNEYGLTPVDLAYSLGDPTIIQIFQKYGFTGPTKSAAIAAPSDVKKNDPKPVPKTTGNVITIGDNASVNSSSGKIGYGIISGGNVTITK